MWLPLNQSLERAATAAAGGEAGNDGNDKIFQFQIYLHCPGRFSKSTWLTANYPLGLISEGGFPISNFFITGRSAAVAAVAVAAAASAAAVAATVEVEVVAWS